MQVYKRVYKRLYARRKNDKQKALAFLDWSEDAAKIKDNLKTKTLSLEEFERQLLNEAAKYGF
jgi:cytidylate kinase